MTRNTFPTCQIDAICNFVLSVLQAEGEETSKPAEEETTKEEGDEQQAEEEGGGEE